MPTGPGGEKRTADVIGAPITRSGNAGATARAKKRSEIARRGSSGKGDKMSNASAGRQKEIDANLDFFLNELPNLLQSKFGKFALIRHRSIVGFYDTPADAVSAGNSLYPDKLFSIQQVTQTPVDLGFYSHVRIMGTAQ